MVKQGFPKRFGAGVITTSGALGILIPPSIVMVIYCVATGGSVALDPSGHRVSSASVGQMFMAGVIPGIMLASLLGLTTFYRAWKNDYPRLPRARKSNARASPPSVASTRPVSAATVTCASSRSISMW